MRNPFSLLDETVLRHLFRVPSAAINSRWTVGTNVFSRDWDVLILLDTCRVDAPRAVADEYDFLDDVVAIRSVEGATPEWITRAFRLQHAEQIRETSYLTSTAQVRGILEERHLKQRSLRESHTAYKFLRYYDTVDISDLGGAEYLFQYESFRGTGPYGHQAGPTPRGT